jgi:glucose-6-phosphate isomerase
MRALEHVKAADAKASFERFAEASPVLLGRMQSVHVGLGGSAIVGSSAMEFLARSAPRNSLHSIACHTSSLRHFLRCQPTCSS